MYDHNQTLVPESFLALYIRNGRLTLQRHELEARSEMAEAFALQVSEVVVAIPADGKDDQLDALRSVKASLLAEPAQLTEPEATWVVTRAAEICGWTRPDL